MEEEDMNEQLEAKKKELYEQIDELTLPQMQYLSSFIAVYFEL